MSFQALPNELLVCIADYLTKQRHLSALIQTNRHNYQVLNTYLYQRNIRHSRGWVLFWAAWNGQIGTAWHAIKAGVWLNYRMGDRKETAILWAAQARQVPMVAFLIDHGADPRVRDTRGYTPMQWAIETGHVPLARLLLERGVDFHDTCKKRIYDGANALHIASHLGHHAFIKLLLNSGFDINAQDHNGNTPAHWSIFEIDHIFQFFGTRRVWDYKTNVMTVKMLLDHGADLQIRNCCGDRPKEQVQKYHFNEAMQRLFDDDSILFEVAFFLPKHLRPARVNVEKAEKEDALQVSAYVLEVIY